MKARTATGLAWALGGLSVAATGAALMLVLLRPSGGSAPSGVEAGLPSAIDAVSFLLFPVVGTLVAWKRPANVVGWLLLCYSMVGALAVLIHQYAVSGVLIEPGSLPGADTAAWVDSWIWSIYVSLIAPILLYFPNGHLPSVRWRWITWGSVLPPALLALPAIAYLGVPARELLVVGNDLDEISGLESWVAPLVVAAFTLLIACLLTSVVSLLVRYRSSGHTERQQRKWILAAGAVLLVQGVWAVFLPGPETLKDILSTLAFAGIPVAMGIAILRHRLYDIDFIINRTLVYGALTAVLAGVYAAGVVGLGEILRGVTGVENNSLAVAASTLAVAALFRPARAYIQTFIDRRFYRAKYDASKTLDTFSARLRDEVDLDELSGHLLEAIKSTMHPSHASLWLRRGAER